MTFEWVKWRRGPRISQMPSSGWSHTWSRWAMTATIMSLARPWWPSGSIWSWDTPLDTPVQAASSTSPNTSSWNCSLAWLPMRTGFEPS